MLSVPSNILFTIGDVTVYWYGLFASLGLAATGVCIIYFARFFERVKKIPILCEFERFSLPLLAGVLIGGRLLFVLYHLEYFVLFPLEIPSVWHGGWVWHGALIGGVLATCMLIRSKVVRLSIADIYAPALALAQSIGRWGNYFNQEAYGLPTSLPWGIPIDEAHRVPGYQAYSTFHPTFLYESSFDFALFVFLAVLLKRQIANKDYEKKAGTVFFLYVLIYSIGRFFIEFIRIDTVPILIGLRAPQWFCLALFLVAGWYLLHRTQKMV